MKSEKGQALVEFALILPLLIILLFGIIDFSRILHAYLTIDHAGREAAREASIGNGVSDVKSTAVTNAASIGLTNGQVEVTLGTNATVKITYPISFLTPIVGQMVGPITITDTTVMRVE
ncbi:TadE/TadG family type IV pilus assembly protein [Neobacillus cucumis]|uniref:Pilus assembly protein TadE n=1 Tax=Neobacillus cucumis TaxID=1740721 RepID=A0A2N5HN68_9BACI|nr:TadE family protein [Neobacillus cucumis]PLS06927.1 pilus assembly protein TadE [Neobacillus cucumis]